MDKTIFSIGGSSGLGWESFLQVCKGCEDSGYFAFYPSDHLMTVQPGKGPSPDRLDALTAMAAVSGYTKRLRMGVLVANNLFRHPVMTAKIFNTIDHASNGRAEFGLGAGWSEQEHIVHGFPFPRPSERIEMLDEALEVIRAIWTDEPASFDGKYYHINEAPQMPKPVQKPYPPIIVGGISARTMKVALKHADDWDQIAPLRQVERNIKSFKIEAQKINRNIENMRFSVQVPFDFVKSKSEADNIIDRALANFNYGAHKVAEGYKDLREHVADSRLIGNVDEIIEQVGNWKAAGVNHFILTTPRPFDQNIIEKFMSKVGQAFL
ncbi:MAG: hypothetical protein CL777_06530 [Chloroflexi bacterium]|nr:hypothetical protein [Chloroflexota bacterium]|tara:strand:+ start:3906 stop:4874 length:969 start_codon:yes stop_codon:yes gene_type:complete